MTGVCLLFVLFLSVVLGRTPWHRLEGYSFENYQSEFNRNYEPAELSFRQAIFERNLKMIQAHNADTSKTWKMGVNHLTDRTEEEFRTRLGVKKGLLYKHHAETIEIERPTLLEDSALPTSVDWREKGIITAVKDQGGCGSCWAFATAEMTESYWALATGKLNDLSIQQITDCTPNPQHCGGTGGCEGATAEIAWGQISKMGGLSAEWTYPYTSYYGQDFTCKSNQISVVAKVAKFVNLPPNEQAPVLNYVASSGPLAISVDASSWAHYETGVYNGCNQTNPDLDHAVMLVGYGTDSQYGDYWIVRNSWSPQWGEQGYIRLHRQNPVTCGIDLNPSDGDGCTGGPPTVTVCGTCGILFDTLYPVVAN